LSHLGAPNAAPEDQVQAVWEQVLGCLQATLNGATYSLAFSNTRAIRLDGDHIVLAVETEFARSWVAQRYQAVLKDALFEVLGSDIAVEVVVSPVDPDHPVAEPPAVTDRAAQFPHPAVGRVHGVDQVMREAWDAGVVLGGVSAGSICWHQGGTTDSFGPDLRAVTDGLALLPYANGVHYDSEEQRRPLLHRLVGDGTLKSDKAVLSVWQPAADGVAPGPGSRALTHPPPATH